MKNKLILYPSTFLWIKSDKGLLYNSVTYKLSEFIVSPSVAKLCSVLSKPDNLYSVVIDDMCLDEFEKKFKVLHKNITNDFVLFVNTYVFYFFDLMNDCIEDFFFHSFYLRYFQNHKHSFYFL